MLVNVRATYDRDTPIVKSRSILLESHRHGVYLDLAQIPAPDWARFFPGEKDLYTLWTRKLVPVFTDRTRISRADLPDTDRALALALLDSVASRSVTMARQETWGSGAPVPLHFSGEAALLGEAARFDLSVRLPLYPEEARGEISLCAGSDIAAVALKLEWQPQANPGRGTILLYPRATKPQYRFGIAAYNRRQFVNICKALLDYCAPGEKLPPLHVPPERQTPAGRATAGRLPAPSPPADLSRGATRIPLSARERWAD